MAAPAEPVDHAEDIDAIAAKHFKCHCRMGADEPEPLGHMHDCPAQNREDCVDAINEALEAMYGKPR